MSCLTKKIGLAVAVCVILSGLVPAHAEFIIDDFSAPDAANLKVKVIDFIDPDPTVVQTFDAGILGGERDILLDVIGTPTPTSFVGEIGDGSFVFGGSSPGTAATIQYDGADIDAAAALVNSHGLGGVDLTAHGDRFALDFLSLDGGGLQVTAIWVTVFSGVTSSTWSDAISDSAGPWTYTTPPFANWVFAADPTNVTAIDFRLNPGGLDDVDFELDTIRIVPEPSTMVLCVLGFACLLGWAWRRRK